MQSILLLPGGMGKQAGWYAAGGKEELNKGKYIRIVQIKMGRE